MSLHYRFLAYLGPMMLVGFSLWSPCMAATFEFAPFVASGTFSNESSWSPVGGPPGPEDNAHFISPATYNVNFDGSPSNDSFLVTVGNATFRPVGLPADVLRTYSVGSGDVNGGSLTLTGNEARQIAVSSSGPVTVGATQSGSLTILEGASLNSNGTVIVGATQSGTLTVLEGGSLTGNDVFIANLENSSGQATFDASSVNIRDLHVGRRDVGNVTISGGAIVESRDGFVGTFPGGQGSLTITGPSSFSSVNLHVGRESIGTFTITEGAVVETSRDGFVGTSSSGQGAATITGAGSHWNLPDLTRTLAIGHSGHGELSVVDGAMLSAGVLSIANEINSSGEATFDGSSVDSRNLHVGRRGTGTLIIAGGAIVQNLEGFVGTSAGGQGTATVTGAGSQWNPSRTLTIGGVGQGELTVLDGASLSSGEFFIAREDNSSGEVTLNASSLRSEALHVGRRGSGTLTIGGGATVQSQDAIVGNFSGSQGALTIHGDSSFSSRDLHVGRLGAGTLTIGGGATVASRDTFVATFVGSQGALTLTGPSSFSSRDLHVGRDSMGTLAITGGATVKNSRDATVGADVTGQGSVTVAGAGSTWISQSSLRLGGNNDPGGPALLTIVNGGLVETGGELRLFPQATALINGGTLRVGSIDNRGGAFHITNGTLHVTGAAGLTLGDGSFGDFLTLGTAQHLIVDHQLTIQSGALLLAHSPLAVGSLTNQGDLILVDTTIDGPVTNAADAHITVLGEVEFNGLVDGPGGFFGPGTATFNGGYSPGASPGVVPFEGNVGFGDANTLTIELGGLLNGQFDRLMVEGDAMLGGSVVVELLDGFTPSLGDVFEILSVNGTLSGQFAGLDQGALLADDTGHLFRVDYHTSSVSLTAVPEPTVLVLLAVGGLPLLLVRRRQLPSTALAVLLLVSLSVPRVQADDITWTGAQNPQFFGIANNWTPNQIPGPDDGVIFDTAGSQGANTRIFDGFSNRYLSVRGANVRLAPEGTYSLTGIGGSLVSASLLVGTDGQTATLALVQAPVQNLATLRAPVVIIGIGPGSVGNFFVEQNAVAEMVNGLTVGSNNGSGAVTIRDGGRINSGIASVGVGPVGTSDTVGVVTVTGVGSRWDVLDVRVGAAGTGTLNIEAGGQMNSDFATLGSSSNGDATVNVRGAGSIWNLNGTENAPYSLSIGGTPSGILGSSTTTINIENGGTVANRRNASIGINTGSTGIVNVSSGGMLINDGNLRLGMLGSGQLNVHDGGQAVVGGVLEANANSSILLDGGTLAVNQFNAGVIRALDWRAGTLRLTNSNGLTVGSGLFGDLLTLNTAQTLVVDHQLTVEPDALFLTRGNLSAGGLNNQGDLILSNNTVDGPVSNVGTAHILGDVEFNGPVDGPGGFYGPGTATFYGGYSPGASPAVVTFEGNVAFGAANTLTIELGGTELGEFDRLEVTGTATLAGALDVLFLDLGDGLFAPSVGDSFEIIAASGGILGTFDTLPSQLPTLDSGIFFDLVYDTNAVTLVVNEVSGFSADFNNDGRVDGDDLAIWETSFGENPLADADGDGFSDGHDFLIWQRQFGSGIAAHPAAIPVPEPGATLLWLLGISAILRLQSR